MGAYHAIGLHKAVQTYFGVQIGKYFFKYTAMACGRRVHASPCVPAEDGTHLADRVRGALHAGAGRHNSRGVVVRRQSAIADSYNRLSLCHLAEF